MILQGYGYPQALVAGGFGGRVAQTANPHRHNAQFVDFGLLDQPRRGDEGDLEHGFIEPTPHGQYNGRSVIVYLPTDVELPPRGLARLERLLKAMKPLTCSIRVRETGGPIRVELHDPAEEPT